MNTNTTPRFIKEPATGRVAFSTANTNRDGTGTIATVYAAQAASLTAPSGSGARADRLIIKATGATTAGMIRVYTRVAAGTWTLIAEVPVAAVAAPGATTESWGGLRNGVAANVGFIDLSDEAAGQIMNLEPGEEIGVSTHNAEAFVATFLGGEY